MPDLPDTLRDAALLIRRGELEPATLVDGCLARIDQRDSEINAWVTVDAVGAREAAVNSGDMLRRGEWIGPLHGIPIGVKDIIDVQGLPTRAGSPLREQHVADRDAEVVRCLREAGAIVLGKTVTTQFACFDPAATANPYDHTRTPGGSSSGSAAAVACGMCYAALGTQTGGSIIRPAAYCGVAGLKPTRGAISTQGVVPVSFQLDHVGPMARTVADLWIVWKSLAGRCDLEQLATLQSAVQAPRLVIPETYFHDHLQAVTRPLYQSAIAKLTVAGADVEHVPLSPSFADVHAMHRRIMAVDAAEYHSEAYAREASAYAPGVASLIEEGLRTSAVDYAAALKHRDLFIDQLFDCFERDEIVWLTPATPAPAPRAKRRATLHSTRPGHTPGFPR